MRLFAGDRIYTILDKLGPGEDEPIEHKMLTKRIEGAQKKVEEQNFDIRKNVLKYDDVLNKQRDVIYAERRAGARGRRTCASRCSSGSTRCSRASSRSHTDSQYPEEWDLDGHVRGLHVDLPGQLRRSRISGRARRSTART